MAETMSEIKNPASDQKPATCNRKRLINELRAKGFSKGKAEKAVNAIFDAMTEHCCPKQDRVVMSVIETEAFGS